MRYQIIIAPDDFRLSAKYFNADAQKWVIIAPATGAIKEYYQKFAIFLSENGWNTIIYDNRGTGNSKSKDNTKMSMLDWGEKDLEAVIQWVKGRGADEIKLVGHSVAGQIFPFASSASDISAAYFVAAQNAYFQYWSGRYKLALILFWYVVIPVSTWLFGYLPGKAVGGNSEDLPKELGLEWSSFGRHSNGIIRDDIGRKNCYERITIPIQFIAVEDDHLLAPYKAVQALKGNYSNAATELELLKPADYKVKNIGHFGFFRSKYREILWPKALSWLENH